MRGLFVALVSAIVLIACATPPQVTAPEPDPPPPSEPLPVPKRETIREMLAQGQFPLLDLLLEQYRAAFLADIEDAEHPLIHAYKAFSVDDSKVLEQIDAWIEARPKSYQAYTAKAYCLQEMGANARGGRWASETKPEQFALMRRFNAGSEEAARRALELQPRSVAPHRVLLSMSKYQGFAAFQAAVNAGLEAFPASYNLRYHVVAGLQPRWFGGPGDYRMIEAFGRATQEHVDKNPKLRAFLGFADWARGQDLETAERYDEAIEAYTRALATYEESDFLEARSNAARSARKYSLALKDAKRAEALSPTLPDDPDFAPLRKTLSSATSWVRKQLDEGNTEQAIAVMDEVLAEVPEDAQMLARRGTAHCDMGRTDAGVRDMDSALRLDPDLVMARTNIQWCLAKSNRIVEAIKRHEAYVLRAPGNGRARYELANLYGDQGDIPSAIRTFGVACKLDYGNACSRSREIADRISQQGLPPGIPDPRLPPDWTLHPQELIATTKAMDEFVAELSAPGRFTGKAGQIVHREMPHAARWAWKEHKKGWVEVQIYFNPDGTAAGAVPTKAEPPGYFDRAAVEAALRFRIAPVPGGAKAIQRFDFMMESEGGSPSPKRKTP